MATDKTEVTLRGVQPEDDLPQPTQNRSQVETLGESARASHPERRRSEQVQFSLQSAAAIALVLAICYFTRFIVITLLVSILFAFMLAPLAEGLRKLRIPRAVAAFIALAMALGLLYGVTYFFYNQAANFVEDLPKYSEKISQAVMRFRQQAETLQKTTEKMLPETKEEKRAVKVRQQQTDGPQMLAKGAGSVAEFLFFVLFIPFLVYFVYFMLTWQEHARAATVRLFKMENRNTVYETLGLISSMMRSVILGNMIIGLFMVVISTIVFPWLKVPYFYFIGFISGFLSLVPYLGVVGLRCRRWRQAWEKYEELRSLS